MKIARTIFLISSFLLVFFLASVLGHYRLITYDSIFSPIEKSLKTVDQLIRGKPDLIEKAKYKRQGLTVFNEQELKGQGLTAVQGWFNEGVQVRLIDYQGSKLNTWPIDFFTIWPEPKHLHEENLPKTRYNFHSQGMHIFPDGSLIASVQSKGTFKMDRCGEVLWTLDRRTHHSIEVDEEGYI